MAVCRSRVQVVNPLGLHARPATAIVTLVNKHASKVKIIDCASSNEAAGNSVISVLSLGAPQHTDLEISVEGHDADEVLHLLLDLFQSGFGELT